MIGTGVGRALAGVTVAVVAAATALAFATIDPPPLKSRKKAETASGPATAVATAAPAPTLETRLPQAALPPPPAPSDFAPPKTPAQNSAPVNADGIANLAIDELRARANDKDVVAMEELGRRLIQGTDIPKDAQAGTGWLMRAAELGSAQSAFNVGVMYERGFVVERDSGKAAEWYRRAADADLAVAKHNLALLLREGKGVPRDGKAAIALLKSAARQGMAASLFSLGDIYDRGDAAPRDPVEALAWFACAGELDRQLNNGADSPLARTADQRAQTLQRTLTPEELARAQDRAQGEFKLIVEALAPAKPKAEPPAEAPANSQAPAAQQSTADSVVAAWPGGSVDQMRAIQQALYDLKLLRDKPDGNLGPATRAAIREFQKNSGLRPTGEPTRDLYLALNQALARRDVVAASPLPAPVKIEAVTPQAAETTPPKSPDPRPPESKSPESGPVESKSAESAPPKPEPPAALTVNLPVAEAPPIPSAAEFARAAAKADPPKPPPPTVDTSKPEPVKVEIAPPPPATAAPQPTTDPNAWPANRIDQVRAIQAMLRDVKIYTAAIDGIASIGTRNAIREYERMAGLKETGEPSKSVFDSLKEMRALMGTKR